MIGRFFPEENPADTLHLFSKILGLAIVLSGFMFNLNDGIPLAMLDFFIHATVACFYYSVSLYVIDGIVLYNFEYKDEILKRKNFAYAIVFLGHCISVGLLIKMVVSVVKESLILLVFLWALGMVFLGVASRIFSILSRFSFNKFMIQMNFGVALSYLGLIFGLTMIITAAIDHPLVDVESFSIEAILKLILSLIILPIFMKGLVLILRIQQPFKEDDEINSEPMLSHLGYGIYEGGLFMISCYLTGLVTEHILFGTYYPF